MVFFGLQLLVVLEHQKVQIIVLQGLESKGVMGFFSWMDWTERWLPDSNQGLTSPICPTDGSKNGGDSVTFAGALIGFQWYFAGLLEEKSYMENNIYIYIHVCVHV